MRKIPKIIHYCWFGNNKMPDNLINYIKGWHRKLPDYKFICWSENNFNWRKNPFTKKEYLHHNWAFVSDYVRLFALYKFGGIYLDTDVQVLKSLNPLLNNEAFMGLENWNSIASGLICGSIPGEKNIRNLLHLYMKIGLKDTSKIPLYYNTVNVITLYFHKYGFKYKNKKQIVNNCCIYPTSYFCPKQFGSCNIHITSNTYTIHHYSSSWVNKSVNKKMLRHIKESNYINKIIGPTLYRKLYKYYMYLKDVL